MYSLHPDLRNSTVVDVPVRRLRPCHSKACYGRERAILSTIRTLRRLVVPVVLLAAEIRASSTFFIPSSPCTQSRPAGSNPSPRAKQGEEVDDGRARSGNGSGLDIYDVHGHSTTPLARSRVAFVPTGTGCTGTRAATQTCSAALVWLTGKALEWLPTLWHTVVTLPKDTIYEIGPDVQIGQTKGKLRSRFTAFVSAILDRLVGRRPSGPRECAQKVETCFFQYVPLI